MKAYIHLEVEEINGEFYIRNEGKGEPEDLIMLIAYLYKDKPDYVKAAMSPEIQEEISKDLIIIN